MVAACSFLFQSFVKDLEVHVDLAVHVVPMMKGAWFHLSCVFLFFHPLCIVVLGNYSEYRTYDDGTEPYISIDSITS